MNEITQNQDYKNWLIELKANIKSTQIKAALAVNSQLIQLYWDLGNQIVEKQENTQWGSGFIDQLSKNLKEEFPSTSGFSVSNIKYCKQFYIFYYKQFSFVEQTALQIVSDKSKDVKQVVSQLENTDNQDITKSQQVVGELQNQLFNIPWGHHILIIQKIKNTTEAIFYVQQLNFYLTAIDRLVKDSTDKPTIGILLCSSKNDVVVDFALHDVNKPMGVSEYTYTQLPENVKQALPTIEQFTEQLNRDTDNE